MTANRTNITITFILSTKNIVRTEKGIRLIGLKSIKYQKLQTFFDSIKASANDVRLFFHSKSGCRFWLVTGLASKQQNVLCLSN